MTNKMHIMALSYFPHQVKPQLNYHLKHGEYRKPRRDKSQQKVIINTINIYQGQARIAYDHTNTLRNCRPCSVVVISAGVLLSVCANNWLKDFRPPPARLGGFYRQKIAHHSMGYDFIPGRRRTDSSFSRLREARGFRRKRSA